MANTQLILRTSIWSTDFKDLSVAAQHLYLALCSQPGISLCGVLPLAPKRWASLSADGSLPKTRRALAELAAAHKIVIDDATEEVLVRTYVKNAGALKMPNVVVGLCRDFTEIMSPVIRSHVLEQIEDRHLIRVRGRNRFPARFVEAYEAAKGGPFPEAKSEGVRDDEDEPNGIDNEEPLPITNTEGFPEPMPIQPTTDNRQPTQYTSSSTTHVRCAPAGRGGEPSTPTPTTAAIRLLARQELHDAQRLADNGNGPRIANPAGWLAAKERTLTEADSHELAGITGTPDEVITEWRRRQRATKALPGARTWGETRATSGLDRDDVTTQAERTWPDLPEAIAAALDGYDRASTAR